MNYFCNTYRYFEQLSYVERDNTRSQKMHICPYKKIYVNQKLFMRSYLQNCVLG